jgi:3'-phosphoadenosine 5'-phosphosulfate sulfotransferase
VPSEHERRVSAHVPMPCFQNIPRPESNIMMNIVAKATIDSLDQAEAAFRLGWIDVAGVVSMRR